MKKQTNPLFHRRQAPAVNRARRRAMLAGALAVFLTGGLRAEIAYHDGATVWWHPIFPSLSSSAPVSPNIFLFEEKQDVVLTTALPVDISVNNTTYNSGNSSPSGQSAIGVGTRVSSYFVHARPGLTTMVSGSVTFNQDVLGIMVKEGTLNGSRPQLGNPYATYSSEPIIAVEVTGGIQSASYVTLSNNKRTVSFNLGGDSFDHIRIVTRVPASVTFHSTTSRLLAESTSNAQSNRVHEYLLKGDQTTLGPATLSAAENTALAVPATTPVDNALYNSPGLGNQGGDGSLAMPYVNVIKNYINNLVPPVSARQIRIKGGFYYEELTVTIPQDVWLVGVLNASGKLPVIVPPINAGNNLLAENDGEFIFRPSLRSGIANLEIDGFRAIALGGHLDAIQCNAASDKVVIKDNIIRNIPNKIFIFDKDGDGVLQSRSGAGYGIKGHITATDALVYDNRFELTGHRAASTGPGWKVKNNIILHCSKTSWMAGAYNVPNAGGNEVLNNIVVASAVNPLTGQLRQEYQLGIQCLGSESSSGNILRGNLCIITGLGRMTMAAFDNATENMFVGNVIISLPHTIGMNAYGEGRTGYGIHLFGSANRVSANVILEAQYGINLGNSLTYDNIVNKNYIEAASLLVRDNSGLPQTDISDNFGVGNMLCKPEFYTLLADTFEDGSITAGPSSPINPINPIWAILPAPPIGSASVVTYSGSKRLNGTQNTRLSTSVGSDFSTLLGRSFGVRFNLATSSLNGSGSRRGGIFLLNGNAGFGFIGNISQAADKAYLRLVTTTDAGVTETDMTPVQQWEWSIGDGVNSGLFAIYWDQLGNYLSATFNGNVPNPAFNYAVTYPTGVPYNSYEDFTTAVLKFTDAPGSQVYLDDVFIGRD